MAEFTIPKGIEYSFTVKVVAKDSFLAQDVTTVTEATDNMLTSANSGDVCHIKLVKVDPADVNNVVAHTVEIDDTEYTAVRGTIVDPALDGVIAFELPASFTAGLEVSRSDAVDGFYPKPNYQGIIHIPFSDDNIANRTSIISKVYVIPTGV